MEFAAHFPTFGWVDIGLAAFLVLSTVFGLMRGLVFEVLAVLGWVAACFAAQWLAPDVLPHVHFGAPGSALNHGVAFAATFIAALVVWGLAARLVRFLVHATPLRPIDRLFGAVFGLARGVFVLLLVAAVIGLTPLRSVTPWQESEGAWWLNTALQGIRAWLPSGIAERLPAPSSSSSALSARASEPGLQACVASSA